MEEQEGLPQRKWWVERCQEMLVGHQGVEESPQEKKWVVMWKELVEQGQEGQEQEQEHCKDKMRPM